MQVARYGVGGNPMGKLTSPTQSRQVFRRRWLAFQVRCRAPYSQWMVSRLGSPQGTPWLSTPLSDMPWPDRDPTCRVEPGHYSSTLSTCQLNYTFQAARHSLVWNLGSLFTMARSPHCSACLPLRLRESGCLWRSIKPPESQLQPSYLKRLVLKRLHPCGLKALNHQRSSQNAQTRECRSRIRAVRG